MRTFWKAFIAFIFALFSLPLALILPSDIALKNKIAALKDHGIEVAAQVDSEDVQTTRYGTTYLATYHYRGSQPSNASGAPFSGKGRMSPDEYVKTNIGGKIPIIYDARDPTQSTTKTQLTQGSMPLNPMFFLALFVGIPAAMAGFIYCMYFPEKRLLQRGSVVAARIVSAEDYVQSGGKFSKVTYEFKDSGGTIITGIRKAVPTESDTRARFIKYRARFYDNPTAIFDPQKSTRNMLYPPSIATLL
jgi:hypothetical protein